MPKADAVTTVVLATPAQIMVDLVGRQNSRVRPSTVKKKSFPTSREH